MNSITDFNSEEYEIVEYLNQTNNEKAESIANKVAKEDGFQDANELYIRELQEMKQKLKERAQIKWWTPEAIETWRKINNDLEQVVWIKKDKWALYILNEIKQKWENLYLR